MKISLLLNNYGLCIAYLIIYLNAASQVTLKGFNLSEDSLLSSKYVQIILPIVCVLPFIYARDTEKLKFASIIAVTSITTFVLVTHFSTN